MLGTDGSAHSERVYISDISPKNLSQEGHNSQNNARKREGQQVVIDPPMDAWKLHIIDHHHLPRVSFVIPTLDSERTLDVCLNSIVAQDYPDIELIVVDNGSKDRTIEIAAQYTDKIYYDNGSLGSVRQKGIDHMTGEVLGSFDSDIQLPHRRWLCNAVRYFNYDERTGSVWPLNVAPPNSSRKAQLYWNLWAITKLDRIEKGHSIYGGGNSLFLKTCIDNIGGISRNIHWGEDLDIAQKIKQSGYRVVFITDPIYHDTDMTTSLRQFVKKQRLAAQAHANTNTELTSFSVSNLFREEVVLGTKAMISGLVSQKDLSWMLFPLFLSIRSYSYIDALLGHFFKRWTQHV
jgi:glycosyltransferase involved in cell wall biosynthesis